MKKPQTIVRTLSAPAGHLVDGNAVLRHCAENGAWIWHPHKLATETAILRFRLRFTLQRATTVLLHVTGDQRFQLRYDGREVTFGPDRCDLEHWTVQSVALELSPGNHELEALAWFIADAPGSQSTAAAVRTSLSPMAQMTWRGGFLLYAEGVSDALLNTGAAPWMVEDLTGAVTMARPDIPYYHDIGPLFTFDLKKWRIRDSIPAAVVMPPLEPTDYGVRRPGWCLFPADIPEQHREPWTGGSIRALRLTWDDAPYCMGDTSSPEIAAWQKLLHQKTSVIIPPHSKITVLWDLENYRCGYPVAQTEGGEGAVIQWGWAESLYEESCPKKITKLSRKGNRNIIENKVFMGIEDCWRLGPDPQAEIPSLWWRCGRYIRIRVETCDVPLTLTHLGLITTGYPLGKAGAWKSTDTSWDRLMSIFERAFRCSSHETWTDTPYYEQMCYVGDTALSALGNYAWFSDTRLSRRCLELFAWSRHPSGFVAERYPSDWRQESPTFSLIWPAMVRDFVWWQCDAFLTKTVLLPGVRCVLAEFDALTGDDGLLHKLPGWPFIDWVPEWDESGCGPGVREGDSSIVNLQWVMAHLAAAQLEEACGDQLFSSWHRQLARDVFDLILARYWDQSRGVLLDTHGSNFASEHAQAFALLTGLLDSKKTQACLSALRKGVGLAKATIYSSFYVLDALYRHGEEAEFHRRLDAWRGLAEMGFTSTPEMPEPTRSDAHVWGAHPAWHSLASIAGVRPSSAAFRTVRIAPCPGSFEGIQCSVNSPHGPIEVDLRFANGNATGSIILPHGVHGEFVWRGSRSALKPGDNEISHLSTPVNNGPCVASASEV